jgi:hypothetical protein
MCRLALRSRDQTMRRLWPCSIVLGNVHVRKTGSVPRKNATHGRSVDEKEQDSNVCLVRRPPSALNRDRKSDTASVSLAMFLLSLCPETGLGALRERDKAALGQRAWGQDLLPPSHLFKHLCPSDTARFRWQSELAPFLPGEELYSSGPGIHSATPHGFQLDGLLFLIKLSLSLSIS